MTDKKCEKVNPKISSKLQSKGKEKKKKNDKAKEKKETNDNHLITEYFSRTTKRIPSKLLALYQENLINYYISNNCDPKESLYVEEIDGKGKGVVTLKDILKGSFICEYAGDLIDLKEAKIRDYKYQLEDAGCYMYYFIWNDHHWCVDATKPSSRFGRLINHSRKFPNCKTQIFVYQKKPRLIFIALRDIKPNEELLYDYGEKDKIAIKAHPWLAST